MAAALLEDHFTRCGRMKIGESLALIGTVVAEFFARSGNRSGINLLYYRILEPAQYSLDLLGAAFSIGAGHHQFFLPYRSAKMFLLRKWQESAVGGEN